MNQDRTESGEQSVAVDRLIAEFRERQDRGQSLSPEEFIAEHPDQAEELRSYFANLELVQGLQGATEPQPEATLVAPEAPGSKGDESLTAKTLVRGVADSETSMTRERPASNTSSTDISISDSFGRYAIQKVLGQGAMGAVYLARDTQLDRDVALKIPKFEQGSGVERDEMLARFYREARAAATLRSPNICPVYDVGEIDGQHYITMAYIEGRPLKDFTKSKKQHSEKQIITTIRKLALGLAEAHAIGVIHRDLKPANIMVDLKGEPVVMDFGLARRSSSDDVQVTQSGAILGTPAYMAPEQVAGDQAAIDHRVDIYALGIIMYELITGEMPFKGNLMALLQQIALNNPKKPSELRQELDPRLEKICLKMIAGDQTKRYQSMHDVANDLQEVLRSPRRSQKSGRGTLSEPKPATFPSRQDESNPALITIGQQPSIAEQLRQKRGKTSSPTKPQPNRKTGHNANSAGPFKPVYLASGIGGLFLLLGIIIFVRVGKYDVQITLDDPRITLSVDGQTLNINDGSEVIKLSAGPHKLQLDKAGLTTYVDEFTVTKDGKTALRAVVINGKLNALKTSEHPVRAEHQMGDERFQPGSTSDEIASSSLQPKAGLLFDMPTAHVDIGSLNLDMTQPFTFEFWCTPQTRNAPDRHGKHQLCRLGTFSVNGFSEPRQTGLKWTARADNKTKTTDLNVDFIAKMTNSAFPLQRQHLAVVWTGSLFEFYVDGNWVACGTIASNKPNLSTEETLKRVLNSTSPPLKFELGSSEEAAHHFGGIIEQVRISTGIRYTEKFTPVPMSTDSTTVALYEMNEGTGDILKDSSGNGHHGKIIGAKWVQLPDTTSALSNDPKAPLPAIAPFDAAQAKAHQQAWADYLGVPVEKKIELPGGEKLTLVLIPPGEFLMGSSDEERARFLAEAQAANDQWSIEHIPGEGPQHRARISKPFYMGKYEVTQAQWESLMGSNPSQFKDDPSHPVEQVSWDDVQAFLAKLNDGSSAEKMTFALPTEVQWEYACRAGTTTILQSGDSEEGLRQYGWFHANAGGTTHPVGQLRSNGFGLYDMHGNVWEWCADWFAVDYYANSSVDDPTGPTAGSRRTHRGGSWDYTVGHCRSAYRSHGVPGRRINHLGFRLAASLEALLNDEKPLTQPMPSTAAGSLSSANIPQFESNDFALDFDGAGSVEVTSIQYDPKQPITIESWVKLQPTQIDRGFITLSRPGHRLKIQHGVVRQNLIQFGASLGQNYPPDFMCVNSFASPPLQWFHVALCQTSPAEFVAFVNGQPETYKPWLLNKTSGAVNSLMIGRVSGQGKNSIVGQVDELRVSQGIRYTGPFTPQRRFEPDANTIALYHFDEGTGDILKDSSGNGHHGKIIGAKWVQLPDTTSALSNDPKAPLPAIAPFDAAQAKAHQQAWADYLGVPVEKKIELPGGEKLTLVLIPPGEFLMGTTEEELARLTEEARALDDSHALGRLPAEGPQHRVRITQPYYLGKYEVTQQQWVSVMEHNPSSFSGDLQHPVEKVSWVDVQTFVQKLNREQPQPGLNFGLPTEAQWEFACRAGAHTTWPDGVTAETLHQFAWFRDNADKTTHPVGLLLSNHFGLYDMLGNVWEWCEDWTGEDYYQHSPENDPPGVMEGTGKASRGGGLTHRTGVVRPAFRSNTSPDRQYTSLGFRLAASIESEKLKPNPGLSVTETDAVVDLLALIDVARDALDPGVRKEGRVLRTPEWKNTSTRVLIPYREIPTEYDLRLVAERKGNERFGLNLGFLMGGRQAVLDMDGSRPPKWCISQIDGKTMQTGNVTTVEGKRLHLDQKVTVELRVRKDGVTALCDGETVIAWKGRPEQLTLWNGLQIPDSQVLFFYSQAEFIVHELSLHPVENRTN